MSVGIQLTEADVNSQSGQAATMLKRGIDALLVMKEWSDAQTVDALVALGFTTEEANVFKSAMGEVPAVDAAIDATQFLSRLWGTGLTTAGTL